MDAANEHTEGRILHRLVFFSDAVFAIVLTLLALELRPPHVAPGQSLYDALAQMTPHFIAFAMSFGIVSLYWVVHMSMTRRLIAFDWQVTWANVLFLFAITLMPFASALVGENSVPGPAWQIYCGVQMAVSISMLLLVASMNRDAGRLKGGMTRRLQAYFFFRAASPGIAFAVGFAFAVDPRPAAHVVSGFCWLLIPVLMGLAGLIFRERKAKTS